MGTPRLIAKSAVFLLILVAFGCQQNEQPRSVTPDSPTVDKDRSKELHRTQFQDVAPPPKDFDLVIRGSSSFSYEGGGVRLGSFRYFGGSSTEDVATYYRDVMSQRPYGWTLAGEKTVGTTVDLTFRKDAERCDVSINRESGGTALSVRLNQHSE